MTLHLVPGSGKTELAITYLSGAVRHAALDWRTPGLGILVTPLMGNLPAQPGVHAHDNGVFSEWKSKGKKPFNLASFLAHLDTWRGVRHMALFAVAPDVIGDWQATLARSAPVLPLIRAKGYRAALVAQNGLEHHTDEIPWDTFDVLFLGGGQDPQLAAKGNPKGEWKLSPGAAHLVSLARAQGKDVHMGRVNSLKRLRYAQSIGCTSADGTIIAFGPDIRTPEVQGWLATLNPGLTSPMSSCYVCRWHAQAYVNTYPWLTVDHVLSNIFQGDCPHQFRPAAPAQLQLAA